MALSDNWRMYLSMDNTKLDSSGNNTDWTTQVGTFSFTTRLCRQCVDITAGAILRTATNTATTFGNGSGTDQAFSVHAVFELTTLPTADIIILSKNGHYQLVYDSATTSFVFRVISYNNTTIGISARYPITLQTGVKYCLTGYYDGTKTHFGMNLYLNLDTTNYTQETFGGTYLGMLSTNTLINMGRSQTSTTNYLYGYLDEVGIRAGEITRAEHLWLYNNGDLRNPFIDKSPNQQMFNFFYN